ncbi:MAG: TIGR02099 family protein [Pseudomonas sp.]|nr:TIGR02099 family protein [Pseudomonas sp.]
MSIQRWLTRILEGLIVVLVIWLLAAAAYVSLGRQFVPAVADYRAELLEWAQNTTGRAISLDGLQGEMQGWQPVLKMRGLRVQEQADPSSPTLLALDRVTARIDIWTSLWERRPVMDALQIEGLALELVEDAEGRWRLHGLGERQAGNYDLDAALETLFEQRRITLLDTHILISPHERAPWVFQDGEITLLNGAGWHRLDGRVALAEGQQISWQLSALEEGGRWQDMSVGFFVDVPPIDWVEHLPPAWLGPARLEQMVAGGQFWGGLQGQQLQYLRGRLDAPLLEMDAAQALPTLRNLNADFALQLADRQQLRVQGLSFSLDDQRWPSSRLLIQRDVVSEEWQVQISRLSLDLLARMVPSKLLPDKVAAALSGLAPSGQLRAVALRGKGSPTKWQDINAGALLDDVSVEAWLGAPAFAGISGSLSGSAQTGELRVDSDAWSIHLPRLFAERWHYDQLVGELAWQWSQPDGLRLNAPGMRAQGEAGTAAVALQLHLPPGDHTPTMDLQVSLSDSQARFSESYLPTLSPAFSPRLAQWLAEAEIEGSVPLAVFGYQGSLRRDAGPGERQLALYARLESGSLAFQPGWPRLEEVDATLRLVNQQMLVDQASARLWQTALTDVRVSTDRANPEDVLRLAVESQFSGPLQDGLRLLQDTPLASATGDSLRDWAGEGQVQGQFALDLPLRESAMPEVDASWQAEAQTLSIPQLQTMLGDAQGQFTFTSASGLRASDLSGVFLGRRVTGSLESHQGRLQATFSGQHGIDSLLGWPLLAEVPIGLAEGQLDWQAQASIDDGGTSLRIDSDLTGARLDLPGPFAKPAEQAMPSSLMLRMADQRQRWQFNLGADLRGDVHTGEAGLRGDVRYRSGVPEPSAGSGLSLAARFEQLNVAGWQQWLKAHRAELTSAVESGSEALPGRRASAALQQVRSIDLRAGQFDGFGQSLTDLAVSGVRNDQGWLFDLDQSRARGQVTVPDLRSRPVVLNMQRLSLARSETEPRVDALASPIVPEDPLADIDPATLPPLDVNIDTLYWGADPVGRVSFQMRPSNLGSAIQQLEVDLRGLRLTGALGWNSLGPMSQFRGTLQTGNIGEVLQAWGYAPTVTSRQFTTTADLTWSGSPAFFALSRSSGLLQLDARNGTLQSGEGSADALRVFGLLNFNALTRRLRLDFSDLFGRGTAYDTLDADLTLTDGVMRTLSPLVMDGPGAKMQLDGQLDLPAGSIDMGMLVTLPVTNNLPLAAIIAGAPYIGGALFLADKILGDRVARFASVKYRVSGDWQQPTVEFDKAFDNEAALEE